MRGASATTQGNEETQGAHLYSITKVPTKLATDVLSKTMETKRTAVAVARLNKTRVSMNFQYTATSGTRPIRPYTMPPKSKGGTIRRGRMSKKSLDEK